MKEFIFLRNWVLAYKHASFSFQQGYASAWTEVHLYLSVTCGVFQHSMSDKQSSDNQDSTIYIIT
jgi:hypothetical protein